MPSLYCSLCSCGGIRLKGTLNFSCCDGRVIVVVRGIDRWFIRHWVETTEWSASLFGNTVCNVIQKENSHMSTSVTADLGRHEFQGTVRSFIKLDSQNQPSSILASPSHSNDSLCCIMDYKLIRNARWCIWKEGKGWFIKLSTLLKRTRVAFWHLNWRVSAPKWRWLELQDGVVEKKGKMVEFRVATLNVWRDI